jgi:glycosyltransferase involved in cell wall biosynthesis
MKISAIVCTCNPRADYLSRVLSALKSQTLDQTHWELLLVDNRSEPPLLGRVDLSWCSNSRVLEEENQGVAYARVRGIAEARGELIVFVDDDNILDSEYFKNCLRIASEWPQLGVWGASITPEFEHEPPAHLVPHLSKLALREVTAATWTNVRICAEAEPWGAGLCVRRAAAWAYRDYFFGTHLRMLSRTGKQLLSGEDTELCFVVCGLGLGMGLFPQLRLVHLIPKERLTDDYIARISSGLTATYLILTYKWSNVRPRSAYSFIEIARCIKQMMSLNRLDRRLAWGDFRARIAAGRIIANSEHNRLAPTVAALNENAFRR